MTIRPALIDDAAPIAGLMTQLGYPTTSEAMTVRLAGILPDPARLTVVAESDRIVGVAGGAVGRYYEGDGLYGQLAVLVVDAEARGAGVGRALVDAVEAWAAGRGARTIVLNTGLQRAGAHAFYERCGYARTGFRFTKPVRA